MRCRSSVAFVIDVGVFYVRVTEELPSTVIVSNEKRGLYFKIRSASMFVRKRSTHTSMHPM